jgi:hypothetical protein
VFAPDGNLITSNGDAVNPDPTQPSEIVEFTKTGNSLPSSMLMRHQTARSAWVQHLRDSKHFVWWWLTTTPTT